MEQLLEFIINHAEYAHIIIFFALLLAGLNIPVSEDAMLLISALIASERPEYLPRLFVGVYAGAYLSDIICYSLGRFFGEKLWDIKFFSKMVSRQKIKSINGFYEKYGIITLIFGRFVPFGVRNALFLTAGLGKMNWKKFAVADFLACTVSSTFFFYIYFNFGKGVIEYVKKGNMIIFAIAALIILFFIIRKRIKRK